MGSTRPLLSRASLPHWQFGWQFLSLWRDSIPRLETIPVTTTPTDPSPDRDEKGEELKRLLKEDSPEGEFLRELRDFVRTEFFGLEPLCPECEEEESESSESEREE